MKLLNIGVLASGRGSNLQAIIDASEEGKLDGRVRVVVSDCEQAMALERAKRHGISSYYINPNIYPDKSAYEQEIIKKLREHQVQIVALAGYMRLVSKVLLRAFPNRVINIHPSLLPSFPGLEAQRQAWEYGVKYSGCTVHFVDEGVDTGPIIAQEAVRVREDDNPETLAERILKEEHKLYPKVLQWIAEDCLRMEGRRVIVLKD